MLKYRIPTETGFTEQLERPEKGPFQVVESKFYVGRTLDWLIGKKEFDNPDEAKEFALSNETMDRFEEHETVIESQP